MNPTQVKELAWSTWTEVFERLFATGELTAKNAPRVCEEMRRNPFAETDKGIQDAIVYLEGIKEKP